MTAQTNTKRDVVEFPPNVPVTLSLKYGQPRIVSGRAGERAMFTTCDDRVLFCDMPVAGEIARLGINVRESFTITRTSTGKRGEPDTWQVARIAGEQPNGTYVVPKDPEPQAAPAPKPPARAEHSSAAAATLAEQAIVLVDAYAEVLAHGLTKHGGKVKPDEIRAIFLTQVINRARGAA